MTEEELAEIEKRLQSVTKGPWKYRHSMIEMTFGNITYALASVGVYAAELQQKDRLGEFIAHSREDIPKLIAEIKRIKNAFLSQDLASLYAQSEELAELKLRHFDVVKERDAALKDLQACRSIRMQNEIHKTNYQKEAWDRQAEVKKLRAALEKIAEYHFDGRNNAGGGACGGGCDMGDSGRKTDSRGHDIGCIFGIAREALK